MTNAEKREAARQFINKWRGRGREDEDDRSYWFDLLQNVMGQTNVTDRVEFQKKVVGADGNVKRIDAYIPETKVLIEQKSLGIDLTKQQAGHNGMTPYEQAKMYDNGLPVSEKARWIVTSNFEEIRIYDMDTKRPEDAVVIIQLDELVDKYLLLDFLIKEEVKHINEEIELSIKAGEFVGKIYDSFEEQYNDPTAAKTQHSLNILCVRLVFCFYAEDAGLFSDTDAFKNYIEQYEPKNIRSALLDLFKVLNTPEAEREEMYLDDELAAFPYCNGGLFTREDIEIPKITQDIKDTLIDASHFNWAKISPTIFGAVFESTLNPETRRAGGMHYTSVENIHKVIDPLFLDDLREELAEINSIKVTKTKESKLKAFQEKLASLKFFDPACGSGNFLTETYISLRRLENKVIDELNQGQIAIGVGLANPIKVNISQFYGIEINDFAVEVAKAALWIAESQMMKETEDIVHMHMDFLPLKTNATIEEGNALRMDWKALVKPSELSYIMGNPPFLGHQMRSDLQVKDMEIAFYDLKNHGKLDYVTAWYNKSADYIKDTAIKVAFVSTNSICQGESVPILWEHLEKKNIRIDFAYRSFVWNSEAINIAHVHCVIIGFSINNTKEKRKRKLYYDNELQLVDQINGYLIPAPNVYIKPRGKILDSDLPQMIKGSQPTDGGNLLLSSEERSELIKQFPKAENFIKPFLGAAEFINNKKRYCLWLKDVDPSEYRSITAITERLKKVAEMRKKSPTKSVKEAAETPMLFTQIRQPGSEYLIVPRVSSERRRYIPFGYMSADVICSDGNNLIPNASIYMFGVMISNVHMAWVRTVCGRLKSDFRYSPAVYNNFPWPNPSDDLKIKIEETAQGILDARELYPNSSLADLYDPLTMPPELRKAHQENDKAVMKAYGFDIKNTSEEDCVAHLMKMYQELTQEVK